MKHGHRIGLPGGTPPDLPPAIAAELARLDQELAAIWNLGDNVLLAWTHGAGALLVLAVRHYAIPESVHADAGLRDAGGDSPGFIRAVLSGPKHLQPAEFHRVCAAFGRKPEVVRLDLPIASEGLVALVSEMVRRYGVSLVHNRAVVLLDAVRFSVQSPLDQMAMLNSLADNTAATLRQLNGLEISGGRIEEIRCYLTGQSDGPESYRVDRFRLRDKHGTTRTVFNAKINIRRDREGPIFLGLRNQDLTAFGGWQGEVAA